MNNPWDGLGGDYQPQLETPQYGANPWEEMAKADAPRVQQAQMEAGQNMGNMAAQAQDYAVASQPYPSFPNSAGLGSQDAYGVRASQPAAPQGGSNPWMMSGPALSR